MDSRPDYTKALVSFVISALFLLFAIFSLPTIIISPQKFTSCFTISMLALIIALGFSNGPANYIKKLTESKNTVATLTLFVSMVFSLYFSIINESYLLSLLCCFIEVKIDV